MKTFDIVEGTIIAKSAELGDSYVVNEESVDILKGYCDVIDGVIDFWTGYSIEADVVTKSNLIVVSIVISALTIDITNKIVLELIDRAVYFAVGNSENNDLRLDFTFPSVWDKKS